MQNVARLAATFNLIFVYEPNKKRNNSTKSSFRSAKYNRPTNSVKGTFVVERTRWVVFKLFNKFQPNSQTICIINYFYGRMKGVLQKQGQVAGSDLGGLWTPFRWRNRYFEERDDKLFYYKQQGDAEPQGYIDISSIVKVEVRAQPSRYKMPPV